MFSNVALSALAFVLALGLLIAFHEFGHFWVARRVGIKVLRYSVGFGRPLLRRVGKVDGTEFVLAAIPLGGYVKMLDEREAPVAEELRDRAFNTRPLWARTAVVLAGPAANFILAIVAWWVVMMMGISGVAPLLGEPDPDSAAATAGFRYEDRILSVDGVKTDTWQDARIALLEAGIDAGDGSVLPIEVETAAGGRAVRQLALSSDAMLKPDGDAIESLGLTNWWPHVAARVGEVVPDSAAARAGLEPGDLVLSVDAEPVGEWRDLVTLVQPRAGEQLAIQVQRGDAVLDLSLVPEAVTVGDRTVGRIGVVETESQALLDKTRITVREPPIAAFGSALQRTWDMSSLTLRMLGKLVIGEASLDNISGPISIAQYAGQSASIGPAHYINFIALISISLAVLNLLPIPMLDGGHLLYFAWEAVRGKPLSEGAQIVGQQIGMVVLGGLMLLAFYNDIWRLLA